MKKIQLLFLFFFVVFNSLSQTNVSGNITTNTTWSKSNSPYKLTSNIGVTTGSVLTIEPGVEVIRENDYTIIINGSLIASGNSTDSIKFISNYSSATNYFLDFQKTNLSLSQLNYASFKNTSDQRQNYIRIGNESEGAQQTPKNSGDLTIANSKFFNTYILTKGYSTTARLLINGSELSNVYILGHTQGLNQ